MFSTSEKPKGHINVWFLAVFRMFLFDQKCIHPTHLTSHVLTVDAREKISPPL